MDGILEARSEEDQLKPTETQTPVPADAGLEAVNKCLAAAAYSLKFDIAELWRFGPDHSKRRGRGSMAGGAAGAGAATATAKGASKPFCEHVYTMPATLKTYTGRIMGIWNSGYHDSRAPQDHLLSPLVFLSLTLHERNLLSMDFLKHISKAATSLFREQQLAKHYPQVAQEKRGKAAFVETNLHDVPVVAHPGEEINTNVAWGELSQVVFLVNGSRCTIYTAVYKDQPVVVKLMRKDVQDAAMVRDELELELALLRRIRHENIVRLLGAGKDPERFLMISLLDGGTLAQRCNHSPRLRDRRGRFGGQQAFTHMELLRCARQLAAALRHLHEEAIPGKMVVHRDLKPDNIGFSAEGDVKLLDLGLSRVVSKSEMDNARYNMTGETGSARYMAPEVAESRPYNEKVDVYSYGVILWEMTTLKKPFDGMGRDRFFSQVVRGSHRPPINKKWPKPWAALMQSCWAEDPTARPSFAKVGDLLQGMVQDGIDPNWSLQAPC
eukprot:jgi/Undpi1/8340/HiC_scaffold_25.g10809.m1